MEFKTFQSGQVQDTSTIPPPDAARRQRKKAIQKLRKSRAGGRRFMSAAGIYGMLASFIFLVNLVAAIFVYTHTSEKFALRNVAFIGCKELNQEQLVKIIRHGFPLSILRIDLRQLKGRLEEETWIKSVEIRRVLPSDLVIYVQERTPSVILEIQGELMIADSDGILLDRYSPGYGKLDVPVFRGLLGKDPENYRLHQDENASRIRQGLSMLSELQSASPSYTRMISEVDLSDRNNLIIMLLDDDAEVHLGKEDYLKRFQTLMKNIQQYQIQKDQYDIASIDMRFPGKIIYQLRGVSPQLSGASDE